MTTISATKDLLCLPLDVPTRAEAVAWVTRTHAHFGTFKVGLELFLAEGWDVIDAIRGAGAERIFLDLKLHDIPNTVAHATEQVVAREVDFLTIHTGGGAEMVRQAALVARGGTTTLLGVTVLTSLDQADLRQLGIEGQIADVVLARARMAVDAGCGGLVSSPQEVALLRIAVGALPFLVTPGIRLCSSAAGDQARIATPKKAVADGSNLLVIGRPVRDAADPEAVIAAIEAELAVLGETRIREPAPSRRRQRRRRRRRQRQRQRQRSAVAVLQPNLRKPRRVGRSPTP